MSRDIMPPPVPQVDAVVNAAAQAGVPNARTWRDLGWRAATFPACGPKPLAARRYWDEVPCPNHAHRLLLLLWSREPLTLRGPDGETIAYRLAVCDRCQTVWYEARELPRRPLTRAG